MIQKSYDMPVMSRLCISLVFLLLVMLSTSSAQNRPTGSSVVFFVATNGNDSWSGQISMPDSKKTNGPFATLPHALQSVRDWKQKQPNATSSTPTIYIRRGIYFLEKPLPILPQDSGLTIAAFRNENPILSG